MRQLTVGSLGDDPDFEKAARVGALASRLQGSRADCRAGKIRRAYSKTVKRGRVISEKPKPGAVLPKRGKVNLVISRGRKVRDPAHSIFSPRRVYVCAHRNQAGSRPYVTRRGCPLPSVAIT
jgi:hypothetical protein